MKRLMISHYVYMQTYARSFAITKASATEGIKRIDRLHADNNYSLAIIQEVGLFRGK